MKSTITVAAGLVSSASALAQAGQPVKVPATARKQAGQAQAAGREGVKKAGKMLDESVQDLEQKVLAGDASPEAFKGLIEQVRTMGQSAGDMNPKANELGKRLERRIADVQERARKGRATSEDFSILREQMIDARLDLAIARVASKARGSKAEREDFAKLNSLLEARAEAAKQLDPQAAQENQNVIRTLNAVQKKSADTGLEPADFKALRSSLAEVRLDRAMADLEKRAVSKNATPADYARVNEVLADRTEAIGTPDDQALQKLLQNALGKLKEKAASGEVTREEFGVVRDNLLKKARAAGARKK